MKKFYLRLTILTLPLLFLYQNCVQAPGVDSALSSSTAGLFYDSANDVILNEYLPTYTGTDAATITLSLNQPLHMYMNHATTTVNSTYLGQCVNCHSGANSSPAVFSGGIFHATLAAASMSQPTTCGDCHQSAGGLEPSLAPGFIGSPIQTLRQPNSPSMKHAAVLWNTGSATLGSASAGTTGLVTYDCSTCHVAPTTTPASGNGWNVPNPLAGAGTNAYFHASLDAAGIAQPTSCIDCHGNSQPYNTTSYNGDTVPDHALLPQASSSCTACHTYPGTGTASNPNWKNATLGNPTTVTLLPPNNSTWASSASATINHPTTVNGIAISSTNCTICHGDFASSASVNGWDHQTLTISGRTACGWCHFPNQTVATGTAFTYLGDNAHPAQDAFSDCTLCHCVSGSPGCSGVRPTFALPTASGNTFTGGQW